MEEGGQEGGKKERRRRARRRGRRAGRRKGREGREEREAVMLYTVNRREKQPLGCFDSRIFIIVPQNTHHSLDFCL